MKEQDEIISEYINLPALGKLAVLSSAINYMQSNNSNTKSDCICLAMGYRRANLDDNKWEQSQHFVS